MAKQNQKTLIDKMTQVIGFTVALFAILMMQAENSAAATVETHHPRLFLNGSTQAEGQADLNRIRLQLQAGGIYHHAYAQALAVQDPDPDSRVNSYGGDYMLRMLKAIVDENGDRAQSIADAKARVVAYDSNNRPGSYEIVWILAMFDWFYDQWEPQDIANIINFFEESLRRDNDTTRSMWNNHFHEDSTINLVLPGLVLAGESAYSAATGDKSGDVIWSGNGMNTTSSGGIMGSAHWMDNELKPVFNQLFGSYGVSHEGNSYWRRGHGFLPTVAMAWTSCTNEDLFVDNNWTMTNLNKGLLHMWRPDDGKVIPWGDGPTNIGTDSISYQSDRYTCYGLSYRTTFTVLLPLMRWGNDPYSAFIYDMYDIPQYLAGIDTSNTNSSYSDIFVKYLWGAVFGPHNDSGPLNNPNPVDINSLPKSVYFDGFNGVVVRSGWEENNVLFGYKQNRLIAGHDHMDAGSFIISRGDDELALDAGYYSTHGGSLDEHASDYYPRTIAHNTITVEKTDAPEQLTHVQWWGGARNVPNSDGGQRSFGSPGSYDKPQLYLEALDPKYDRGPIARFEYNESEGYTYFTGDVTSAYFSDEGDPEDLADNESVANFTRTVLTPDAQHYIVLDRVSSTDAGYPKRWILHTQNGLEAIDGTKGAQDASDGSIVYSGGNEFYTENGSSRLFVKMLAPDNNDTDTLIFRGGSGYEYWSEYDSSGFNADQVIDPTPDPNENPGSWRVEEKIEGETDSIFLNVLYATDTSTTNIGHAEQMVSSFNVLAVALENFACVFSKPETKNGAYLEDGSYTVTGDQITRHIVTDLSAGAAYDVSLDGTPLAGSPFTSSEKGILTFAASQAGTYRVVLNGTAPGITAAFSADATGLSVQFTDTSTGGPTAWSWDFNNDGTEDSTLQHPSYTYPVEGTYAVSLTATRAGSSQTVTREITVTPADSGDGSGDSGDGSGDSDDGPSDSSDGSGADETGGGSGGSSGSSGCFIDSLKHGL